MSAIPSNSGHVADKPKSAGGTLAQSGQAILYFASDGTVLNRVPSGKSSRAGGRSKTTPTSPIVFAPYGAGDGASTFGLPNRAYLAVGRDNASGSASNVIQVSTTVTLVSGNSNITVASAAGLAIGMFVSHPKLQSEPKSTEFLD
jgi:hypothetical protein